MTTQIEDANAKLREAVEARRDAQAAGKPSEEWYPDPPDLALAGDAYLEELLQQQRLRGDGLTREHPGSLPFLELVEELRQLHFKKTSQYGGASDPFENVTASAKCGVEPWRRALCDLSDCVVRMQKFANGQPVDYENALIDAANWSLICLLKLREDKRA
jgi:hypothetical protein